MSALDEFCHLHQQAGAKVAEGLFLEVCDLDTETHAEAIQREIDAALRAIVDSVGETNERMGIRNALALERMGGGRAEGFLDRWQVLCGGNGSRA